MIHIRYHFTNGPALEAESIRGTDLTVDEVRQTLADAMVDRETGRLVPLVKVTSQYGYGTRHLINTANLIRVEVWEDIDCTGTARDT